MSVNIMKMLGLQIKLKSLVKKCHLHIGDKTENMNNLSRNLDYFRKLIQVWDKQSNLHGNFFSNMMQLGQNLRYLMVNIDSSPQKVAM